MKNIICRRNNLLVNRYLALANTTLDIERPKPSKFPKTYAAKKEGL